MKIRFLTALTVLLAATGLAVAQPDLTVPPTESVWEDTDYFYQWWGHGQYLLWTVTDANVFVGSGLDYGYNSGYRLGLGYWFDYEMNLGAEFNFLHLPPVVANYQATTFSGSISNSLWGFEVNLRTGDWGVPGLVWDFIAGFRNLNFSERWFDTTLTGSTLTRDWIRTQNHFYGGQVGAILDFSPGIFFVNSSAKLGVGCLHELDTGFGTSTAVGTGVVTPSGLWVSPSPKNINRTRAALVPEFDVKVGVQPASWLRTAIGYNWLGISKVARPADITGVPFVDSENIWFQGLTFYMECRF